MPVLAPDNRVEYSFSDAQLLARFFDASDEGAFAALMSRHAGMVYGVCHRLLGHSQDAEDATQVAFLLLAQKGRRLLKRASLAGWLHNVARNVASHVLRARQVRQKHEQKAASMQQTIDPSSASSLQADSLNPLLDGAIEKLPSKFRMPVLLHHLEGYSLEEGAAMLSIPAGTFASRLSRGRDLLHKRLKRDSQNSVMKDVDRKKALEATASFAAILGNLPHPAPHPTLAPLLSSTPRAALMIAGGNMPPAALVSGRILALTQGVMRASSIAFFTRVASALGAAMVLTAAAAFAIHTWSAQPFAAGSASNGSTPAANAQSSLSQQQIQVQVHIPADLREGTDDK